MVGTVAGVVVDEFAGQLAEPHSGGAGSSGAGQHGEQQHLGEHHPPESSAHQYQPLASAPAAGQAVEQHTHPRPRHALSTRQGVAHDTRLRPVRGRPRVAELSLWTIAKSDVQPVRS